jgi:tRNA (guanine37-N1)-methyltransferase
MRQISFITIHPKIIETYKSIGVLRAAETSKVAAINAFDLRDYAADKHGSIDDSPYGGGDGMVMRADCLSAALAAVCGKIKNEKPVKVICTSPSGKLWNQSEAKKMAESDESLVFICGRFAGIDQRFVDECVNEEYSLGDVVYGGGELPALLMAESILRLVPGVLGHDSSASEDSFGEGLKGLLEYPSYTRPPEWKGYKVPEILLSGDHKAIREWRLMQSMKKTRERRPDLLKK